MTLNNGRFIKKLKRIIIVHWNKNIGPEKLIQYPPEKIFIPEKKKKKLFLKIWALHELDKESSMIEYIPELNNEQYISIIQRFEGEIYFLIIAYDQESKIKQEAVPPDILAIISKNLIELINTNKITRAISEAFNTLKNYSKLEKEEDLLNFFKDKIKFTILKILQEGVISKLKLNEILRNEYGFSTVNIDLLLISFIREKMIIKKNIPGSKECYFLIKDISCTRIPPKNLPDKSELGIEILKDFKEKLINFYSNYDIISEIENKVIINFLMKKDVYSLIEQLRENSISVSKCLDILNNNEELFHELLDKKFLYESKGVVALFSDIRFIKFTPFYIIEKLSKRYLNQIISFDECLAHLKLLTGSLENYPSLIDYEIV